MKEVGTATRSMVISAKLSSLTAQYSLVPSSEITWRAKASMNGLSGIAMRDSGKNHRWMVKVNLPTAKTVANLLVLSRETSFFKIRSSSIL